MAIQFEYAPWDGKWLHYDWFKLLVLLLLLLISIRLAFEAPAGAMPVAPTLAAPTVVLMPTAAVVTVDAPVLTSPAAGVTLTAGPVTLTGEATPGSLVQVLIDGKPAGTVSVDASGVWSLQTMLEQEGPHELVAQAIQADGMLRVSAAPRMVLVAAAPPAAPTLDLASSMPAGEVVISGVGEPGATIEVLVDGQAVGQARVDSAGRWSLARALDAGQRQIVARNIDSAGQAGSGTAPVAITILAAPATGPMITVPVTSPPASSDSGTAATGDTPMMPAALPDTSGADIPWGAVLLLALALLAGGALVRWWARQRTHEG